MAGQEFIYDYEKDGTIEEQALNLNSYYRQGYRFAGWSLTKGEGVNLLRRSENKKISLYLGELTYICCFWTP